jgi:hypothetical protein
MPLDANKPKAYQKDSEIKVVAPAPSCQWEKKSVSYEAAPTLVK